MAEGSDWTSPDAWDQVQTYMVPYGLYLWVSYREYGKLKMCGRLEQNVKNKLKIVWKKNV